VSRSQPDPGPRRGSDGSQSDKSDRATVRETEERLRQQIREVSGVAFRRVEATAPPGLSARLRRLRERARSRRSLDTAWRMMVLALGLTLLLAGIIMFLIPGPGFATVILGLVVLGSEFTWATRVLDPVKEAARRASEAALDPRRRRRNLILGAIAGVVAGIVTWWYLARYGLTFDPILNAVEDFWAEVLSWFE
jgi:uncharacterized protein (TIGR02611 family)